MATAILAEESADSKQQLANSRMLRQAVVNGVVARQVMLAGLVVAACLAASSTSQAQQCPDPVPQTTGSHSFRKQGESFEIPIVLADCHPVALELRWANGRNNGTNLQVTFLDSADQPIHRRSISAFVTGSVRFPFATMENQRWVRAGSVMMSVTSVSSIPKSVRIEAVWPFALPATVSYRVTRVAGRRKAEEADNAAPEKDSSCDCAEGKANPQIMQITSILPRVHPVFRGPCASELAC